MGQLDESLEIFERALGFHRRANDRLGEGSAYLHRGIAFKDKRRYLEGRTTLECALEIFQNIEDRRYEAVTLQELGNLARHEGRLDDAATLMEKSLEMVREIGLRRSEAMALTNLGNIRQQQGRDEEAIRAYHQSMAVKEDIGESVFGWVTKGNLGEMLLKLERPEEALPNLETALAGARSAKHLLALGVFASGLGVAKVMLGDIEEGLALLDEAESVIASLNQPTELVKMICRKVESAWRRGDFSSAKEELTRAERVGAGFSPESAAGVTLAQARQRLERAMQP